MDTDPDVIKKLYQKTMSAKECYLEEIPLDLWTKKGVKHRNTCKIDTSPILLFDPFRPRCFYIIFTMFRN